MKLVCVVNGNHYEVIENYRDGWNEEEFTSRYSEILHKYDYIVGDWGYNQLRLRGFFEDKSDKANFETKISSAPEYLLEFCNFGCPYFIVKKVKSKSSNNNSNGHNNQSNKKQKQTNKSEKGS
ncbi:YutD family protein [Pseudalkalibacillus sp. SCS-8]|uniref:YutD family protein n=1 Tax=Pseudalkalibacillus nanhaiensis TaxID=3115291 RepID=UPI0032DA8B20